MGKQRPIVTSSKDPDRFWGFWVLSSLRSEEEPRPWPCCSEQSLPPQAAEDWFEISTGERSESGPSLSESQGAYSSMAKCAWGQHLPKSSLMMIAV